MSDINNGKAQNEYGMARDAAKRASAAANDARALLAEYKNSNERLINWKHIMATALVKPFTAIFVAIVVVEAAFSWEIYRELLPRAPWAIALIVICFALFCSEMLVYFFSPQKRGWKKYELERDPNNSALTEEMINDKVQKTKINYFILGLVATLVTTGAVAWLSYSRVENELAAGMRLNGFNFMDALPVILYVIEVVTGVFVMYLINQLWLGRRVSLLWKKFTAKVNDCAKNTSDAIAKYQIAEMDGYSAIMLSISDDLHECFYRDKMRDINNEEAYILICEKAKAKVLFKFEQNGTDVARQVDVVTDFKFSNTKSSNKNGGIVQFEFDTFPGDTVRDIYIRESVVSERGNAVTGTFELNNTEPHTILI